MAKPSRAARLAKMQRGWRTVRRVEAARRRSSGERAWSPQGVGSKTNCTNGLLTSKRSFGTTPRRRSSGSDEDQRRRRGLGFRWSSARKKAATRVWAEDPRGCGDSLKRTGDHLGVQTTQGRRAHGGGVGLVLESGWDTTPGEGWHRGPTHQCQGHGGETAGWRWRVGPAGPEACDAANWAGVNELGRGLRWLPLGYCWARCYAGLKREKTKGLEGKGFEQFEKSTSNWIQTWIRIQTTKSNAPTWMQQLMPIVHLFY
jgi:hypothetical protein